ncbi:MAG: hypothetical protein ACKERG_04700 [Candidatus Hodgkinia cicadicola]
MACSLCRKWRGLTSEVWRWRHSSGAFKIHVSSWIPKNQHTSQAEDCCRCCSNTFIINKCGRVR